jgi:tetratricopeptide (TPR) repeat protein
LISKEPIMSKKKAGNAEGKEEKSLDEIEFSFFAQGESIGQDHIDEYENEFLDEDFGTEVGDDMGMSMAIDSNQPTEDDYSVARPKPEEAPPPPDSESGFSERASLFTFQEDKSSPIDPANTEEDPFESFEDDVPEPKSDSGSEDGWKVDDSQNQSTNEFVPEEPSQVADDFYSEYDEDSEEDYEYEEDIAGADTVEAEETVAVQAEPTTHPADFYDNNTDSDPTGDRYAEPAPQPHVEEPGPTGDMDAERDVPIVAASKPPRPVIDAPIESAQDFGWAVDSLPESAPNAVLSESEESFVVEPEQADPEPEADAPGFQPLEGQARWLKLSNGLVAESRCHEGKERALLLIEAARIANLQLGSSEKAEALFSRVESLEYFSSDLLRMYAELLGKNGKRESYNEFLTHCADRVDGYDAAAIYNDMGIFNRKARKPKESIACFQKSVQFAPDDWFAHRVLAQLLIEIKDLRHLLESLGNMIDLSTGPLSAHLRCQRALLMERQKRRADALAEYKAAFVDDPNMGTAVARSLALISDGTVRAQFLDELYDKSQNQIWSLYKALTSISGDNSDTILKTMSTVEHRIGFWISAFILEEEGRLDELLELLDSDESTDRQEWLLIRWMQARLYYTGLKDPERALVPLQEILEEEPRSLPAADMLLDCMLDLGRPADAVLFLQQLAAGVEEPAELSAAYLCQAAFIAESQLKDSQKAAELLKPMAENEGLTYFLESILIRGHRWQQLAELYVRRSDMVSEPREKSRWLLQAATIYESRLDNLGRASTLYMAARKESDNVSIGLTDLLRIHLLNGDWAATAKMLQAQADTAVTPLSSWLLSAQISHIFLGDVDTALKNLDSCLEANENSIPALLLDRRLSQGQKMPERFVESTLKLADLFGTSESDWLRLEAVEMMRDKPAHALQILSNAKHLPTNYRLGMLLFTTLRSGEGDDLSTIRSLAMETKDTEIALLLFLASIYNREHVSLMAAIDILRKSDVDLKTLSILVESIGEWRLAIKLLMGTEHHTEIARLIEFYQGGRAASPYWKSAFKNTPDDLRAAMGVERCAGGVMEEELADAHKLLATNLSSNSPKAYHGLLAGHIYERLGNVDAAVESYQIAFNCRRHVGKPFQGLQRLFEQTHRIEELDALYESLTVPKLRLYAEALEGFREFSRAASVYQKLIDELVARGRTEVELIPYLCRLEHALERAGLWADAAHVLQRRIQVWQEPTEKARLQHKLRWVMVEHLSDSKDALDMYLQLLEQEPESTDILEALARIYSHNGEFDSALTYLARLLDMSSSTEEEVKYQRWLAEVQLEAGDIAAAHASVMSLLDSESGDEEAGEILKKIYRKTEDWEALVAWLQRESEIVTDVKRAACLRELAQVFDASVQDENRAMEAWKTVLEAVPEDGQALRRLVILTKRNRDHRSYVSFGERLIPQLDDQEKQEMLLEMGELCYASLNSEHQAERFFSMLLEFSPPPISALHRLERIYEAQSRSDKLIEVNELIVKHSSEVGEQVKALLQMASLYENVYQTIDEANLQYERILEVEPNNVQALRRQANNLFRKMEWQKAVGIYVLLEEVEKSRDLDDPDVQIEVSGYFQRYAYALEQLSRHEESLECYRNALKLNPFHLPSLKAIGPLLIAAEDWKEASNAYGQIFKLTGGQGDPKFVVDLFTNMGLIFQNLEQFGKSRQRYQKALEINPSAIRPLRGLADVYFQEEDWTNAIRFYQRLLRSEEASHEDIVDGLMLKGYILDQALQKLDKAEMHYQSCVDHYPNYAEGHFRLMEIYLRQDLWKKAEDQGVQALSAIAQNDALNSMLHLGMALSHHRQESNKEAEDAFRMAMDSEPNLRNKLGAESRWDLVKDYIHNWVSQI